jgi:glucuronate isomerase
VPVRAEDESIDVREVVLDATTADRYFDEIGAALAIPAFRPRALFERFNIEPKRAYKL